MEGSLDVVIEYRGEHMTHVLDTVQTCIVLFEAI